MALDTFTKAGVTTYTFARGNTFPIDHSYTPNTTTSISGGGTSKAVVNGVAQEYWGITLNNITNADTTLLYGFFNNSLINWGEQLFIWTDHAGTSREVRLWNKDVAMNMVSGDLNVITLKLKVET